MVGGPFRTLAAPLRRSRQGVQAPAGLSRRPRICHAQAREKAREAPGSKAMTDPITVAVLQNRLNAIAEEMGEAMLRTAYSQILNSSRDFSIALIDAQCRLVAQADHIPVHVGAMPWAAKALTERVPAPLARRCLSAERSVSRRLASARPDRIRAGLRRPAAAVLVGGPSASLRYRRRNAWRLQPRRDGNLARGPAPAADAADRKRRAARRPAGDAGAECPPSRATSAATWPRRSVRRGWASSGWPP